MTSDSAGPSVVIIDAEPGDVSGPVAGSLATIMVPGEMGPRRPASGTSVAIMLDHVSITVDDLAAAVVFYDAALGALGHDRVNRTETAAGYGPRNPDGRCYVSIVAQPSVTSDDRHWAFRADSRAAVQEFHAAALASGGRDDGGAGARPEYHDTYYSAFVLDPTGNRVEAVCHRTELPMAGAVVERGGASDVAELVVLQRCCWVSEAVLNETPAIPALHESHADVAEWVTSRSVWTVRLGARLVGAVRAHQVGDRWEIGRLMVAPDLSGRGVGRWLLEHAEGHAPAEVRHLDLFTGARSARNLRMYAAAGYVLSDPPRERTNQHIQGAVFLSKRR